MRCERPGCPLTAELHSAVIVIVGSLQRTRVRFQRTRRVVGRHCTPEAAASGGSRVRRSVESDFDTTMLRPWVCR